MSKLANKIFLMGLQVKEKIEKLCKDESGETNIIAIILILAIVVALAIIFKDRLSSLFNNIWSSVFADAGTVLQ